MPKYKITYNDNTTDTIFFKNHQELDDFKENNNDSIISVKLLNGFIILPNIEPHLTNSAIYNSELKN